jgi:hypothetical protein
MMNQQHPKHSFLPERREGVIGFMCLLPSYCLPGYMKYSLLIIHYSFDKYDCLGLQTTY